MGFRFWKRINFGIGSINLQKGIPSLSVGPRGTRYTVGRHGQRATIGIPGTGMYYTRKSGDRSKRTKAKDKKVYWHDIPRHQRKGVTKLNKIFECIEYGDNEKAYKIAKKLPNHVDCFYIRGHLAFQQKEYNEAILQLDKALKMPESDYFYVDIMGEFPTFAYTLESGAKVQAEPDTEGYLIGLILAMSQGGNDAGAIQTAIVNQRHGESVKLLSIELEQVEGVLLTEDQAKYILEVTKGHGWQAQGLRLALWRSRAQVRLKLLEVALETVTKAVSKGKACACLIDLRYQKGIVLKRLEKHTRALKEFQWVYCENPTYKDVKKMMDI